MYKVMDKKAAECANNMMANADENLPRMMTATSSSLTYETEKFTTQGVTGLVTRWYPYRRWLT